MKHLTCAVLVLCICMFAGFVGAAPEKYSVDPTHSAGVQRTPYLFI